jgi:hypothetical protein
MVGTMGALTAAGAKSTVQGGFTFVYEATRYENDGPKPMVEVKHSLTARLSYGTVQLTRNG